MIATMGAKQQISRCMLGDRFNEIIEMGFELNITAGNIKQFMWIVFQL
ncbi:MAG: hypothetical protein RMY28_022040 [Nostoc sp. ChiSLP01]|nr:hypothetical protein [Nostoc sp. CmiSLP01]MDZ8284426.1 hypothetical protein [Nostoc sp. ChiSLP01]